MGSKEQSQHQEKMKLFMKSDACSHPPIYEKKKERKNDKGSFQ